jgi:diguanylate cyclase (GGDEF)-like protein
LFLQDEFPAVERLLSDDGPDRLIGRNVAQSREERLVAAFVRLSSDGPGDQPFVVLGLGQLQSHVLTQASRAGADIARIALLFSLLALVVAFIASRTLIRPLRSMTDAVELFSRERKVSHLKPRDDELGVLARSFTAMKREILGQLADLTSSRAAFEHLARHDALTGLPNRRMCFEQLEQALQRARRQQGEMALLFVDLDHFKAINDQYGHRFGDQVLVAVAKLLTSISEAGDSVARLGGDEFIIFIDQVQQPQKVLALLQKLHHCLQLPLLIEGHRVKVHASIGVSLYPRDGDDIETLVQQADHAMYRAKSAGKNQYAFEEEG